MSLLERTGAPRRPRNPRVERSGIRYSIGMTRLRHALLILSVALGGCVAPSGVLDAPDPSIDPVSGLPGVLATPPATAENDGPPDDAVMERNLEGSWTWIASSGQQLSMYGTSVSSAGDVNGDGYTDAIVGAMWFDGGNFDEGKAYVYYGSATGLSATADWTAEGNVNVARYGSSVSTAGDVNGDGFDDVIVGSYSHPTGGFGSGRAFVYLGSASGLSTTPAWQAGPGQSTASYGIAVSTAGDVNGDGYSDVIVGAPGWDGPETAEGKIFLYFGSAGGLSATPDWTVESNQPLAGLGNAVASAGDVNADGYSDIVVGAPGYPSDEGTASLYLGSATGPAATPAWTGTSGQSGSLYAGSLDGVGDVNGDGYGDVVVGSPFYDNGQNNEGRAWLYLGTATGLEATAAWTGEVDQASASFGTEVSGAGDVDGDGFADVIVGANGYFANGINGGAAFLFTGTDAGLSADAVWVDEPDQANAQKGVSVSSAGDVNGDGYGDVLIGATQYDVGGTDDGAAFLFLGTPTTLTDAPDTTLEGQPGDYLGYSLAIAGDVNGDGFDDIYAGAEGYDNGENNEGAVFVFPGSADGAQATGWSAESNVPLAWLGRSGSTAGDVNGDGYDDIIGGAPYYDGAIVNEGQAFVFHGSPTGMSSTPAWTVPSGQADSFYAYSSATAGDVNGDGYSDVIVGAYSWDDDQPDEGAAFVYLGSPTGLDTTPAWTTYGDMDGGWYGYHVATAGDVNGDGYDDVFIGARGWDNPELSEGAAWIYAGSATGLSTTPLWNVESNQAGALFGRAGGAAGDLNGDGYGDLVVGGQDVVVNVSNTGAAWVFYGSATGPATTADVFISGYTQQDQLGFAASAAGDVNGDGYGDLVLGAFNAPFGGNAYLHLGSASGVTATADWSYNPPGYTNVRFGHRVAGGGDLNGDGYGDVLVSSRFWGSNSGAVFVFYGNGGDGPPLHPAPATLRALRPGSTTPIPYGGRSGTDGAFDIAGTLRSPFGRLDAQLEVEVKPWGTLFDGTGLTTTAWTDTLGTGAAITVPITGLAAGGRYHWRARRIYDGAVAPAQTRSPWFQGGASGSPEGTHVVTDSFDEDGDGFSPPFDCDETDASVYPGAPELCDLIDSDCDGDLVDGDPDADGDGVPDCVDDDDDNDGDPDTSDCAPFDATIYTGATELCDAIDSNCDGDLVDQFVDTDGDADPDCIDLDDDNDGDPDTSDCAPLDASIYTGATELCDAIDSNCDGSLVDQFVDTDGDGDPDCIDLDDDNDGDPDATDCDDADATVYTGATELCDGVDSDCNGSLVDGFLDTDGDGEPDCFDVDDDNDGILDVNEGTGDIDGDGIPDTIDLDDTDGPDADPDGDGLTNATEALIGTDPDVWDTDGDGDGDGTDCAPLDPDIAGTLPELCDVGGVDNDCDPTTDENVDGDGDGLTICDGDCDDADATVYPGAPELCDGLDNDCDGLFDADEQIDYLDWYADADGDGFGDPATPWANNPDCLQPTGHVEDDTDCDDGDADVSPDGVEICEDGIDQDCDGADLPCGDDDDATGDDDDAGDDDDDDDDDDDSGSDPGCGAGCSAVGGTGSALWLIGLAAIARRRRLSRGRRTDQP